MSGLLKAVRARVGGMAKVYFLAAAIGIALAFGGLGNVVSAFGRKLVDMDYLPIILPAAAFAEILKRSWAGASLARIVVPRVSRMGQWVLPASMLLLFLANTVVVSASACVHAFGPPLLEILASSGIALEVAAAAIMSAVWGATLNPSGMHVQAISDLTHASRGAIVGRHALASFTAAGIVALVVLIQSRVLGGRAPAPRIPRPALREAKPADFRLAAVAATPLLLVLLSYAVDVIFHIEKRKGYDALRFLGAMFIGIGLLLFQARRRWRVLLRKGTKASALAYRDVVGLFAACFALAKAFEVTGLPALIKGVVQLSGGGVPVAVFGLSAGLAFSFGSGDAVSPAIYGTILKALRERGQPAGDLLLVIGACAWVGAELGRCASPFSVAAEYMTRQAQARDGTVSRARIFRRAALPMVFGMVAWLLVLQV